MGSLEYLRGGRSGYEVDEHGRPKKELSEKKRAVLVYSTVFYYTLASAVAVWAYMDGPPEFYDSLFSKIFGGALCFVVTTCGLGVGLLTSFFYTEAPVLNFFWEKFPFWDAHVRFALAVFTILLLISLPVVKALNGYFKLQWIREHGLCCPRCGSDRFKRWRHRAAICGGCGTHASISRLAKKNSQTDRR